jgi:syntaxin 5
LTFIIKQDIAGINKQIAALQSYVKHRQGSSSSSEGKMVDEHNNNVVMMLQSNLATTSMTFKDVLELRTQVSFIIYNVIERVNNRTTEYEGI